MNYLRNIFILLLLFSITHIVNAGSAAFQIDVSAIKVGDAPAGWIPTYGPGRNIAIDNNRIHVAYTDQEPVSQSNVEIRYVASNNLGNSWGKSLLIAEDASYNGNGVHLAYSKNPDDVHFVWGRRNSLANASAILYANKSTRSVTEVNGLIRADDLSRSIAADATGSVHIVFKGYDATGVAGIYYSHSGDGGASFDEIATLIEPLGDRAGNVEPDVAVDANGSVYVTWYEWDEAVPGTYNVLVSQKMAQTWSTPVDIDGGYEGYYPAISIADPYIVVAWFSADPQTNEYGIAVSLSEDLGLTWDVNFLAEDYGSFRPGIAVDSTGILNMVWEDQRRGLMFSRSVSGGRRWSNSTSIDPLLFKPGSTIAFTIDPKIILDAEGQAYILYHDGNFPDSITKFTREK